MSYTQMAVDANKAGYQSLYGNLKVDAYKYPTLTRAAQTLNKSANLADLKKDVGNTNTAQLLYVDGGLFTDCCLERPVLNTTLTPIRSLANMIPVVRRNTQKSRYAFLTDIGAPTGTLQDAPCDDPQEVGDLAACFMEMSKGRISFKSRTLELDKLIQRLCDGIRTDLYLVGDVRGVSAPFLGTPQENLSLVYGGAVRRQMQLIGRQLQRELLKQFWVGDPTNAALNSAGGGAKQFWGLDFLISDAYGTAATPWVEGTQCDKLNADIKDFGNTCIGAANATTGLGLYGYMQELEDTLFNRAALQGYSNVEWVWVMHPRMWASLVKHLPCEMLAGTCSTVSGATAYPGNAVMSTDGLAIATVRQELQRTMTIDVNGRNYPVVLDDTLPVTETVTAAGVTYTGNMYFVPLTVDGEMTLFWETANYMDVAAALAPMANGLQQVHGWTDGGFFLWSVEHRNYCFNVRAKMEAALYFLAPFLSGKIENLVSCNLQSKDVVTL